MKPNKTTTEWEKELEKSCCEDCKNNKEHEIKNCGVEKTANFYFFKRIIRSLISSAKQEELQRVIELLNSKRVIVPPVVEMKSPGLLSNELWDIVAHEEKIGHNKLIDSLITTLKERE